MAHTDNDLPVAQGRDEAVCWDAHIRQRALRKISTKPAPPPRWLRWTAILMVVALHVAMLLALRSAMRIGPPAKTSTIEVVFVGANPPLPPLPEPPPFSQPRPALRTPPVKTTTRPRQAPQRATAAPAETAAVPARKPLQLFLPNGYVWQPKVPVAPPPTPRELAWELMHRGHNILHCTRTMFAGDYRKDESLGDRIARRYLSWIGMYGQAAVDRLKKRQAEALEDCDGF